MAEMYDRNGINARVTGKAYNAAIARAIQNGAAPADLAAAGIRPIDPKGSVTRDQYQRVAQLSPPLPVKIIPADAPSASPAVQRPAMTTQQKSANPRYAEDFTVYEIDFLALANGATANGAIAIQADSEFKWTKATMYATIANAAFTETTRPVPSITVQILDTGSGRQLFNSPVPVSNIFGIGQLPFILPAERVFAARSSIGVTVTNFDAAVTYNLRLSFIGTKVFKF